MSPESAPPPRKSIFLHIQREVVSRCSDSPLTRRRASSTAQPPMVGRVEASKRATCAADHLRATLKPRTEGGGAVKCGYKQLMSQTRWHIEGQVSKRCWGLFRVTEERSTPTNAHPMVVGRASVRPERTWRSARAARPASTERTLANWNRSLLRKKRVTELISAIECRKI